MQRGKNPTREQKRLLSANGLDPKAWFYIKDAGGALVFREKTTGDVITLDKNA